MALPPSSVSTTFFITSSLLTLLLTESTQPPHSCDSFSNSPYYAFYISKLPIPQRVKDLVSRLTLNKNNVVRNRMWSFLNQVFSQGTPDQIFSNNAEHRRGEVGNGGGVGDGTRSSVGDGTGSGVGGGVDNGGNIGGGMGSGVGGGHKDGVRGAGTGGGAVGGKGGGVGGGADRRRKWWGWRRCRRRRMGRKGRCLLMYEWYEDEYWGAVHGWAGIIHVLMDMELKPDEVEDVKGTLKYMISNRFSSGNYPAREDDRKSDVLVHWCHGALGTALTLVKAAKVFGDKEFLDATMEAGEVVWNPGLLKKVGICHDIILILLQLTHQLNCNVHVLVDVSIDPAMHPKSKLGPNEQLRQINTQFFFSLSLYGQCGYEPSNLLSIFSQWRIFFPSFDFPLDPEGWRPTKDSPMPKSVSEQWLFSRDSNKCAFNCDMGVRPSDTGVRLSYGRLGHYIGRTIPYAVARHFVGRTIPYAVARHFVGRTISYAVARHFVIPNVRLSASSCRTVFVSMESAALSRGDGIPCEFFKVSLRDRGSTPVVGVGTEMVQSVPTWAAKTWAVEHSFVAGVTWASFGRRPSPHGRPLYGARLSLVGRPRLGRSSIRLWRDFGYGALWVRNPQLGFIQWAFRIWILGGKTRGALLLTEGEASPNPERWSC
ncbi:LanC-like protein [Vigna angularis]|uniref:LanC-like protein n=1 Tax=Phaseolus angularis TaxID=3914 RepID=A0A8T0KWZ2_PHAAN|nr:LanC-like protein [Vigna angularis]